MTRGSGKRQSKSDRNGAREPERKPAEELERYETTEKVVLSSDDGHTPTSVILEVREKGELSESFDPKAKNRSAKPHRSTLKKLLRGLRQPERDLILAYKKSGFRKQLLEKSPWYKDFEENRIIGRKLEAAYGGASNRRYRLQRFVRDNLLFSLLLCIALVYAGRFGVTQIVHLDPRPDSAAKTVSTSEASEKTKPSVERARQRQSESRKLIEITLAHCSVRPAVREALLSTLGRKFEFGISELDQAMREFRLFQRRYRASGVTEWFEQARVKSQIASDGLEAVLPRVRAFLAMKKTERRNKQLLLEKQELVLKSIDDSGPLQGVARVNERIKVRNQIKHQREQIDQGPTPADLLALEDQLVSSTTILAAVDTTENSAWNPQAPGVQEVRGMDVDAIEKFVRRATQNIDALMSTESNMTAKLDAYRVRNLRDELRRLTTALAVNKSSPARLISTIEHSQQLLNARLDPLLSKHTVVREGAIDYGGCLRPST